MQLTSIIRRAAQVNPTGIATIQGDRQQTWAQFVDRVSRLAGALRGLGVGPGDRVALLSLNSDRYLEYYYAVVWAGGAMMPMNVRWAPPESAYALNDAGARILMVDDAFAPAVPAITAEAKGVETLIFCGDGDTPDGMLNYETLVAEAAPAPDANRSGDDLADVFYTGGTTGFPKGVMLSHTNLFVGGISNCDALYLKEGAIYLHVAPMFHIADLIFFTAVSFVAGTHVVVPRFTPEDTLAAIEAHKVTHVLLVPVMLQMVLQSPQLADCNADSLQYIGYGASPITEAVLAQAFKAFPKTQFLQAYGQTELAPVATILDTRYHTFDGPHAGKLRSAGQATRICEVRIVGADGTEVPRGEVGEITVSGPVTMLGYWNKPDITAKTKKDGWVYTGDAGYMDDEGFVFLVDRLKDMIVSGGENVYSTEVENALARHPAVATSAVIGIPSDQWGEAVHAIVILNDGMTASEEELKAHCHDLIAGYKCPRSISFRTDPMPLSGANKVLKTELRKPFWDGHDRAIN